MNSSLLKMTFILFIHK